MTSLVDAESVLAIDVGSMNTRALLFDVVDGVYHMIASASASTTAGAPYHDVGEGVHTVLSRLQEITGRVLIGSDARLLVPTQADGSGVDRLALTCSAGRDIKILAMGLLNDVSLQSVTRLAGTTYGRIVDTIGLNDRRKLEEQLDTVLQSKADVILLAGGTEKGATRSVLKLVDLIVMACQILPRQERPVVLYCGNNAIVKRVKEKIERETVLVVAPNIRPTIDQEDLAPAEAYLARVIAKLRILQLGGMDKLTELASTTPLPSAYSLGRIMRFSSELSGLSKPTLGVDLGSTATVLSIASTDRQQSAVYRSLGMGSSLEAALQQVRMEDVTRWLQNDLSEGDVLDVLYQKSCYPASLPLTPETLAIEQAMAREILRTAVRCMQEQWPGTGLSFERVFLSGASLAQAPTPAQRLMIALDGVQPVGINVFMLDPYGLSQALGTIAGINTLLPAQIIDSGAYINLGTVISPVSDARPGTTILRVKIAYDDNTESRMEVKQGSLVALPVRNGQSAHLEIDTLHDAVLDPSLPRLRRFRIMGGICGAVIDARGRPVELPKDPQKRREQLHRWSRALEERKAA